MAETKDNRTDIRSETSETVHSSASGDKRTPASAPKRKPGRPRKTDSAPDKKTPDDATTTPDKKTQDSDSRTPDKKTQDVPPNAAAYSAVQKRARHEATKKRSRPDTTIQPAPGDNTKLMLHAMKMFSWERPDMTSRSAVYDRCIQYFQLCANDDVQPMIEGLASAFCVSRVSLWHWVNGNVKSIPPEVIITLKRAYNVINAMMADYMAKGKINPVAGIFLMKNNMGYTDQTEVVVKPSDQGVTPVAPEQLAETYLSNMADVIEAED